MVLTKAANDYLRARRDAGAIDVSCLSSEEARAMERSGRHRYGTGPRMASVENERIPISSSYINVRLLYPINGPTNVIVYFHGGGWVTGEIDDYDALLRTVASEAACTIAIVEYRKAPEHPFPAAADDAITSVNWIVSHIREKFGTQVPLIVAGDSAGGNLAAVVAQAAQTGAIPQPMLQILIYPVLDCDFTTPSYQDPENQLLLTRESMEWFWRQYAPSQSDREHVMASPARAPTLSGLPPALVITAEHDVLRSEGEQYAYRMRAAGVDVTQAMFEGQMHGFFSLHNVLPASEDARRLIVETIMDYKRSQNHGAMGAPDRRV